LQREVSESGKVVKFPRDVTMADGEIVNTDVVRVGVFNIVYDGGFLKYDSSTGSVSELQRQPEQGRYTNSAEDMLDAT
jgi:biopolymer transport protein ExbB